MAQVEVSAIDYLLHEGTMLYKFQVRFGRDMAWVVSKSYDNFAELHSLLEKHYTAVHLPQLAGMARPWAGKNAATAAVRLQKLEMYLNEMLAAAPFWSPRLYNLTLPDPDGGTRRVHVNKFLGAFLELLEHTTNNTPQKPSPPPPPPGVVADANETDTRFETPPQAGPAKRNTEARENIAVVTPFSSSVFVPLTGATRASSTPSQVAIKDATPPTSVSSVSMASELPPASSLPSASLPTVEVKLHSIRRRSPCEDSRELVLAAAASTITSELVLTVKDFSILERDHIEYFLHVSICGHHWVVSKRYRQFHDLRNKLVQVYGPATVPLLPQSRVPAWRKLTVEMGEARKLGLNQFLQNVVMNVDSWEPRGLLANFELSRPTVRGERTHFTVYINQILFEFLGFSTQIDALSGEAAAKAVVEHRAMLPEPIKMAYDKRSLQEKRLRMRECIDSNAQRLRCIRDDELQVLLDQMALLQDDRDIMRMFKRLLLTGEVDADIQSSFADAIPDDTVGEREKDESIATVDAYSAVVGVTALQVAKITERLFFNDSKIEAIRLFACVLVDADDLQDVFDTLWFGWEEAREAVEQALSRR
ncbi:hypothetical protein C3747_110g64 [Trypanosoma cruzi]|uniref:PX domain-containing protein n=2 Tax=Trypanosoma cruzi TaxID=5693 RepID=Q4DW43_TRYCC|nr:uncharacterized protein Tc00.1047053507681.80 [Trypanosoma cruzi]EAN96744.1 hypothetical protein Tc00.1047053507681.80 [Trypanosoma cruzi]PWV06807.1 hypothetical protein C3747_110g64 [Trypanosoma cruzi]|eukprot:XP_818595.1 hypothetical protein Tc00.1047053507681.80 [Trypanosoma cruzi strain CL Brener]